MLTQTRDEIMPDPCQQQENIKELRGELREILLEIRNEQRQAVGLLENIARQDERLRAIAEIVSRHDKSIEVLYNRVRTLESAPGQAAGKAWWVVFGTICSMVGAAITAFVMAMFKAVFAGSHG